MRWQGRRESGNVEDRRSMAPAGMAVGGGASILLVVLYLLMGGDPADLQQMPGPQGQEQQGPLDPAQEESVKFVKVILADTEDVWHELFRQEGRTYQEPKLVLFRGRVESACGLASSAVGPFYCPGDGQVYVDLKFFDELKHRFGAPGDFAQAYVIAHEVGHHVQNLLGISEAAQRQQSRLDKVSANRISVRVELQADYLAGVWAHHIQKSKKVLEPGDIREGLVAAEAIGDDRLQEQGRGYVVPDSFTHGSSEQRIRWFSKGFETGDFAGRDALFELDYDEL
jgi:predicted metalloprotease